MSVAGLIGEIALSVEGRPPSTGHWRKEYRPGRPRVDGGRSNNLPRLGAAVVAAHRPEEAAEWWAELLGPEWDSGPWDSEEPGGRAYGGATWMAELGAYNILRRLLPEHPAVSLLSRSLTRRAAWYALTGVREVVRLGARGQEIYKGMGSLTTGGRSNHFEDHPADEVMHRVLLSAVPRLNLQPGAYTKGLDTLMRAGGPGWTGVDEFVLERLRGLVASEGTRADLVRFAFDLFGPTRTLAPLWVRRYQDGTLACAVEWNPSMNTSTAFLVASKSSDRPLRLRDQVVFLHPYGGLGRVRGTAKGREILGHGETWWEGDTFVCANLRADMEGRQGPRYVLRHTLPPASSATWEVRLSPDALPRLTVGGVVDRTAPPPGPPPPPPERPEPPAPPPEPVKPEPPEPPAPAADGLILPPRGLHVLIPQEDRKAVVRLTGEGATGPWEFVRWHE